MLYLRFALNCLFHFCGNVVISLQEMECNLAAAGLWTESGENFSVLTTLKTPPLSTFEDLCDVTG